MRTHTVSNGYSIVNKLPMTQALGYSGYSEGTNKFVNTLFRSKICKKSFQQYSMRVQKGLCRGKRRIRSNPIKLTGKAYSLSTIQFVSCH